MIEYPEHIATAIGICPIVDMLYRKGILSVGHKRVQMTEKAFHEQFHTWFTESERTDEYVEHHHILMGADFFCLAKKEQNNGLGSE